MTVLLLLGALSLAYVLPIAWAIPILLAIVYFSYRQTIASYRQTIAAFPARCMLHMLSARKLPSWSNVGQHASRSPPVPGAAPSPTRAAPVALPFIIQPIVDFVLELER
jgi:hypothetical protein